MKLHSIVAAGILIAACAFRAVAQSPDFDAEVAPILAVHCLDCHSGREPKGKLDLSRHDLALRGGESGAAIDADQPIKSMLWERVASDEMPPKKPLSTAEKKVLQAWVNAGAKWGTSPIDPYGVTSGRRAGYDWWSLQPIQRTKPAVSVQDFRAENDIDRYVLERLKASKLAPSPPADKRTLIRRLTFDLTGLPPTTVEVEEFVRDESPEAYAKVVKRLLDSPHYGERWARHWLDVAHFGESDGFEFDRMRPNAWRYRDWVIDALNRDLPFDEFARLQIAGDVLRPDDPSAITAAGFLVHGAHDSLLPAGDTMKQIMRQDELEDIVGLVAQSFLGLTVHCARCHDHKFDPIRADDYYRLASSLAGVRRGDRNLPAGEVPTQLTDQLVKLRHEQETLSTKVRERIEKARGGEKKPEPPEALARWEFSEPDDDLKLVGGGKIGEGALVLDGKQAHALSPPITDDIQAKTLEAWVQLSDLEQRGGGVISLQSLDGSVFDAIVFAERDAGQWMAGSDFFRRTKPFEAAAETQAKDQAVQVAIVYAADGTVTAYRNGESYGKPYKSAGVNTFKAGQAQVVLGMRHGPPGANKMLVGRIERAALYNRALSAEEIAASAAAAGNVVTRSQLVAAMTSEEQSRFTELDQHIKSLDALALRIKQPLVYSIKPQQPDAPTHVLLRGNPLTKGGVIAPGGLSGIKLLSFDFALEPTANEGERRQRLAQWITHENNPLFARTIANRVWHYHFGSGLIETPSDLGFNGGAPSHPELLDLLASELIANRWSLKHLHRITVLSATYRQSSLPRAEALAVDRGNRLLWRHAPRRLEAEAVRDAVLSISGELNSERGGPSYQDFRPYDNHNAQYYEPIDSEGIAFNRRSIYRMWTRGGKSPLLDALDCPDPSTSTPKRGSTTTPLQALAMLNNSFMLRMSDHLANRLAKEAGDEVGQQVELAFALAYSRPPSDQERRLATTFVSQQGLAPFCRVLLNTNGFLYVD